MSKKVQLLVSQWCPTCPQAEQVWQRIAEETDAELEILDVAQRPGRDIIARLMIRSVPATVIDDRLTFVGVPDPKEALAAVQTADAHPQTA
ncbi:thioredoxin family protein [Acidihalobacter ferrooxydans]|uniref:Thioredoxin-like fold domain-containing protein n=1 Tax=Acidihalobacter ferrooxydans TaxID=1765967 RepID=A0A1P8UJM3_9GAMM|nr:thioredoxin family protein [Acidihalobacter ferrooxydans]APZ43992.1 hypothetical protein BW247_13575 [Acidihalobacter ferrooxydans]